MLKSPIKEDGMSTIEQLTHVNFTQLTRQIMIMTQRREIKKGATIHLALFTKFNKEMNPFSSRMIVLIHIARTLNSTSIIYVIIL
jgi:hypothetical protein